jgi:hypothetical protein
MSDNSPETRTTLPMTNSNSDMSAQDLTTKPIEPHEFDKVLTTEHETVLQKIGDNVFRMRGTFCTTCGTVDCVYFANTMDRVHELMNEAGSEWAAINHTELSKGPRAGLMVCTDCGNGSGADFSGHDIRVLPEEHFEEYREHRDKLGEPL